MPPRSANCPWGRQAPCGLTDFKLTSVWLGERPPDKAAASILQSAEKYSATVDLRSVQVKTAPLSVATVGGGLPAGGSPRVRRARLLSAPVTVDPDIPRRVAQARHDIDDLYALQLATEEMPLVVAKTIAYRVADLHPRTLSNDTPAMNGTTRGAAAPRTSIMPSSSWAGQLRLPRLSIPSEQPMSWGAL
jgi:hypothetical protein